MPSRVKAWTGNRPVFGRLQRDDEAAGRAGVARKAQVAAAGGALVCGIVLGETDAGVVAGQHPVLDLQIDRRRAEQGRRRRGLRQRRLRRPGRRPRGMPVWPSIWRPPTAKPRRENKASHDGKSFIRVEPEDARGFALSCCIGGRGF